MRNELGTRNRNANRSGRSPACWTESTKVNGAEGAVNTECRIALRRKGDDIAERLLDLGAAVIKLLPAGVSGLACAHAQREVTSGLLLWAVAQRASLHGEQFVKQSFLP